MTIAIDLYVWSLALSDAHERYAGYLSPDENDSKVRFVYDHHRDAYVAARGRLREILGGLTGTAAAEVAFTYGPNGKPAIAGGPSFNLSHAGGIACLAVHDDVPLGVDIEAFREVEPGVAERFFSSAETAALAALAEDARVAGFFRCWTRKEALIKALGGGLSIPLDAFDVSLDADAARLERLDPTYGHAADWTLMPFAIGDRMPGAVAVQTRDQVVLQVVACDPGIDLRV